MSGRVFFSGGTEENKLCLKITQELDQLIMVPRQTSAVHKLVQFTMAPRFTNRPGLRARSTCSKRGNSAFYLIPKHSLTEKSE